MSNSDLISSGVLTEIKVIKVSGVLHPACLFLVLLILYERVYANTHAQIGTHLAVAQIYKAATALARFELFNQNCAELLIELHIEAKVLESLQLHFKRVRYLHVIIERQVRIKILRLSR